jgi:type IV pilus assembly protein PilQ
MKNFLKYGLLAILLTVTTLVFAEDQNSVVTKVVAGSDNVPTGEKQVLTPVEQKMQKMVSVDFRNTPMEDVIRILAAQADIDIVKSPNVVGNVTATLTNVPLGEALRNILAAHGYAYVADQHLIRVVTRAEVGEQQEALVNKVYQITYADVKEVENSLKKFISPRGSISANPGTNNLIITDTESKIRAIDTFIKEVDRMTPQVLVEARIYDITSTENYDLGIDWQAGRPTTFSTPSAVGGTKSSPSSPFVKGSFSGSGAKQTDTVTGALRFGWLNNNVDIDAIIKAQQENIEAKLLANPRVLVLDNETAKIDIVHEIPYQQLTQGLGVSQFGTIEFKEVGVKLKVTPTREGMIRIKLQPEFSVQGKDVDVGATVGQAQAFPVPSIDRRTADTTLLIKDGQTVVMGGLRKKDVAKQVNKIPLLGDLPLLGPIFRFSGESTAFSEIVVFVTPHIIEQPLKTDDMTCPEKKAFKSTEFPRPKPGMTEAEEAAAKVEKCTK